MPLSPPEERSGHEISDANYCFLLVGVGLPSCGQQPLEQQLPPWKKAATRVSWTAGVESISS